MWSSRKKIGGLFASWLAAVAAGALAGVGLCVLENGPGDPRYRRLCALRGGW
jgi:hypothetical protein